MQVQLDGPRLIMKNLPDRRSIGLFANVEQAKAFARAAARGRRHAGVRRALHYVGHCGGLAYDRRRVDRRGLRHARIVRHLCRPQDAHRNV
jgi:hypothetical protein